ncbi:hypothetical protein ACFL9U_02065 [Thermodesulfobacteriota bacterium]
MSFLNLIQDAGLNVVMGIFCASVVDVMNTRVEAVGEELWLEVLAAIIATIKVNGHLSDTGSCESK